MHPLYQLDPDNPALNPLTWYNLVGAVGCVLWGVAYVLIIKQCFKERSYGLPLLAICMNFAWELMASFVFPNPVPLWHFFDRAWLLLDIPIVFQLWRWGAKEERIGEIRKHFHAVLVLTFLLCAVGLYTFVDTYRDRLGLMASFCINLTMSVLFLFLYFDRRPSMRGISKGAAICKGLGTAFTSIECHCVVRMIDPELKDMAFLTFLSSTIFAADCLYVYLVFKQPAAEASAEPAPQGALPA